MAVGGGGIVSGMSPKGFFDEEGAEHAHRGHPQVQGGAAGRGGDPPRRDRLLPPGVRHRGGGARRRSRSTWRACRPTTRVLPRGRARRAATFPAEEHQLPGALQPEADLQLRGGPGPARRRQRAHGVPARLRSGGLLRAWSRSTASWWASSATARASWARATRSTRDYPGIGGKLYRQGLIKMNEFVTLCGRDRVPIVWFQDTSGIDVGDIAEKAELLGPGPVPDLLHRADRRPHDAAWCCARARPRPTTSWAAPRPTTTTPSRSGTPTTEIYVMHGETAAAASFARRLVKEKDAGKPLSRSSRR